MKKITIIINDGPSSMRSWNALRLANNLTGLTNLGVIIWACGTCMQAKGMAIDELTEGVTETCMMDVCNSIKESDNVLVF